MFIHAELFPALLYDLPSVSFYLWYSIEHDFCSVMRWLLRFTRCRADMVGREDLEMISEGLVGRNAFHFAVKTGATRCMSVLLELDAVGTVNDRDKEGLTPLLVAAKEGNLAMVELLLRHSATELRLADEQHTTPLMHSAAKGYANIVQLLLQRDRDSTHLNAADNRGYTALSLAVQHRQHRVVRLLLDCEGVDVGKSSNDGRTPLMYAARRGYIGIVNLLLETKRCDVGGKVDAAVAECDDATARNAIRSRLAFYRSWKSSMTRKQRVSTATSTATRPRLTRQQSEPKFYKMAANEVALKRERNDWNLRVDADEEHKRFATWAMQLEVLNVCVERHDEAMFSVLWRHWVVKGTEKAQLRMYYFVNQISQRGWRRLLCCFVQRIESERVEVDWRFIPSEPREIELMAEHQPIDEMAQYLHRLKRTHSKKYLKRSAHLKLMIEFVFLSFGQSAASAPELAECLRFVLAETMRQCLLYRY